MGVGTTAMDKIPFFCSREIELSSEYSMGKLECIATEQGGCPWMENH